MRHVAWGASVALGLAAGLAACDAPRPAQPALWTLYDVAALYAGGASDTEAVAKDAGLPGGVAIGTMLNNTMPPTLAVRPGFADTYLVGYTTSEVWAHFDEIWAQPVYIPVTGWSGGPQGPSEHPIFSVGAGSLFYSPFWRMIYVEVADGAATSVREILDGKYRLHPSRGWVAPLAPEGVGLGDAQTIPSGGAIMGTGWLDGAQAPFIKYPVTPVAIGDDEVIDEVPIFHFVFVSTDGALVAPAIPAVLGSGPIGSHVPMPTGDGPTAKYNGYWRVYNVLVPAPARVFAPPGSDYEKALNDAHVPSDPSVTYGMDVTDPANAGVIAARLGRVAMRKSCFGGLDTSVPINGSCNYLDSQYAIEANVDPNAIVRTDVTVTCPIVSLEGAPVVQP